MLPDSIAHFFLAFFLISLAVFVFIPALVGYWRLAHGMLVPIREGFVRLRDIPIMIVALLLTNAFYYKVGSGSSHPLPHDTLRLLLILLDLLFVLFWLDTVVVSLLTRRTKYVAVPANAPLPQADTNEAADTTEPAHTSGLEDRTSSSSDAVQTDENQAV